MNFIIKIIILLLTFNTLVQAKINKFNNFIYIKNNILIAKINKINGNINKIKLLKYKDNNWNKNLNNPISIDIYKINNNKKKKINFIKKYIYANKKYIKILWKNTIDGISYKKYILLNKNSYKWNLIFEIKNNTKKKIFYKIYSKLINKENFKKNINSISLLNKENKFDKYWTNKISNLKILKTNLNWTTISEKYFSTILIPKKNNINNNLYIKKNDNKATIKYINSIKIEPNIKKKIEFKLWIGPNLIEKLNHLSKNLDWSINYGKLSFISRPILKFLININKIVNNFGYSIIIITLISKILTYPLNKLQFQTVTKIKNIQPKIKKIKIKYKNNTQKINKKITDLYKKNNINPITNFLIILIQIPIFISIYNAISQSVEFKNSKFLFWIKDLSLYDKYYILPIIMGISMILVQKQNNNKNIFFTPLVFTILSIYFPSGILLYYTTNNFITFIQQKYILQNY